MRPAAPPCHGSRGRSKQTAGSVGSLSDFLVVTHPFHPLSGQRLPILFTRRYAVLGRVYICEGGPCGSVTLPEAFTDRGTPPEPRPLTASVLVDVLRVVAALTHPLTPTDASGILCTNGTKGTLDQAEHEAAPDAPGPAGARHPEARGRDARGVGDPAPALRQAGLPLRTGRAARSICVPDSTAGDGKASPVHSGGAGGSGAPPGDAHGPHRGDAGGDFGDQPGVADPRGAGLSGARRREGRTRGAAGQHARGRARRRKGRP
ncbi:MAG: Y4bD/Y4pK family protein [Bryobacteraceae bacterium]|nr:Y4bD/Y4pK family protein [Bryobacteraceae bacterium]